MKGRRGKTTAYDVDVMTLTYRDTSNRRVEFRRDTVSFPADIRNKFAARQPVFIDYVPGQPNSERWQGKRGGWKVPAVLFLLLAAAFPFCFRRGLSR